MSNTDDWGLFADEATRYDVTVELVAPRYKEMHEMLLRLAIESIASLDRSPGEAVMAVDIGSGTGADAVPLLKKLTCLRLVGVDASAKMHNIFKQRAPKAGVSEDRFHLIEADALEPSTKSRISSCALEKFGEERFHIALSAFTLHHFALAEKEAVFRMIYDLLEPGGVFLLGDLFNYAGESPWLHSTIEDLEMRWLAANFDEKIEKAETGRDAKTRCEFERLKEKWIMHYGEENDLDAVTTQVELLRKVGFREAGNPFRYWQVGLVIARK
jgi:ubiquinone/menaquinone biosynthesis C-methylase UbiE